MTATSDAPATITPAALTALALVTALSSLGQSSVAAALPQILGEFGATRHIAWVVGAFLIASTTSMLVYGRLSDAWGRRRLLVVAIGLYVTGSALCGQAGSVAELVGWRVVQGLGSGGFLPLTAAALGDLVAARERGRYQSVLYLVFTVFSLIGPLVGGAFTDLLSWRWLFYANLPLGILALLCTMRAVPGRRSGAAPASLNLADLLLLTLVNAGLFLLLSLPGGGVQAPVLAIAAAGVGLLLAVFVWRLRRAAEPIMPIGLLQDRVIRIGVGLIALSNMSLLAAMTFAPLYFQRSLGQSALVSGLLTLPMMIGFAMGSAAGGKSLSVTGRYRRMPLLGFAMASLAFLALGLVMANARQPVAPSALLFFVGFGLSLVSPTVTIAVQDATPANRLGAVSGLATYFRSVGGMAGVASAGSVLAWRLHATAELGARAYGQAVSATFLFAGLIALFGLGLAFRLEERGLAGAAPPAAGQSNAKSKV